MTSTCPRFTDLKPRCAKCGVGHKTDNCSLKCSFCLGMGHTKKKYWKKNGRGPYVSVNFLEVNDEEATLTELN